ncbi:hypothetical protein A3C23_01665 [Candidatus Roizmanbacteria bacterium RIFCSPHIGHO2_02_FULL_37_13b]|uniref:Glycosyltransferase 2-like domain-containing protein n=1 Tax=Candidatus Roizmanbacteria bacterium RIFCSPLOWO2_02_FULL_36_11 TaxID=1802071 RepID=A0A1F7JCW2_9BACT|nr:MAG: hypothetical protein A3C23_01665 [Candidatus Roizmanbacteria bacterium RIFCSPHIGHO2_02_FULL_37_13b]OGK53444.1 MAG: hypothetical protein A3H78_02825 [Candidatus Roizmanbacteria bacterium RIFCSPLOWO2_02_FULL_36_11]
MIKTKKRKSDPKVEKLKLELKIVSSEKKQLETILKNIFSAKTFKAWQFYCHNRDSFLKKIRSPHKIKKIIRHLYYLLSQTTRMLINGDKKLYFVDVKPFQIKQINSRVSVIIPTFNAGKDFKDNLLSINKQQRIYEIEIIIVDNNSSDQTVKTALSLGCTIMKINNFSHSRSRNLGAKSATGDYIIFTVQDANFKDSLAFCKLLNFIKSNKLAAASGQQIPNNYADNFSKWQMQRHYDFMNPKRQNIIIKGAELSKQMFLLDFFEKRKLMLIDDVFSCFNAQIFKKYYFSEANRFAEDIELTIKLLKDKFDFGVTPYSQVLHSHNRDSIYYFKRTFVDICSLNSIFKESLNRINSHLIENINLILNLMIAIELSLKDDDKLSPKNFKSYLLKKNIADKYNQSLFYSYFYKILKNIKFDLNIYTNKFSYSLLTNEIISCWKDYLSFLKKSQSYTKSNHKADFLKISAIVLAGYLGEIVNKITDKKIKRTFDLLSESI